MRIEDIAAAQVLLHEQLKTDWAKLLNGLALGSCPALSQILRPLEPEYYWSADETGGRRTSCLNRLRHWRSCFHRLFIMRCGFATVLR
ncbi:MAG: hypothetical protein HS127_11230 [Planctomycetia bacterium]|nr:hypothetical protein [Planctomycetia bacterium]